MIEFCVADSQTILYWCKQKRKVERKKIDRCGRNAARACVPNLCNFMLITLALDQTFHI